MGKFFMEHVEELINQKISTYARNKALADLKGLGDALAVYHESLESWIENRNNTRVRSVVKNQYIALELMFVQNFLPLQFLEKRCRYYQSMHKLQIYTCCY